MGRENVLFPTPTPSLGRKGLLRLSLKVGSLTNAGVAPVRYETLCGLGSEIRAQSGARGRGQRCVPYDLRISPHKPFRVGTMVPPLSRKGSSSGRICFCQCHQIGLTFLLAVTSEPVSQPLLQVLTHSPAVATVGSLPTACQWQALYQ